MRSSLRVISTLAGVMMTVPGWLMAQGGLTITGQVRTNTGGPLANANVFIQGLNLGASTREDGHYTIAVPAAQAPSDGAGPTGSGDGKRTLLRP